MKTPKLICAAIVIAGVSVIAWWLIPASPVPNKIASTAKVSGPERHVSPEPTIDSSAKAEPVSMAKQPIPTVAPTQSIASPSILTNPQSDLRTAIPDIARLTRTGNMLELARTYMPPAQFAQMAPQYEAGMNAITEMFNDPRNQSMVQRLQQEAAAEAEAFEALSDQTPIYDDTGNKATYIINSPSGGGVAKPIAMIKIDGLWYLETWKSLGAK